MEGGGESCCGGREGDGLSERRGSGVWFLLRDTRVRIGFSLGGCMTVPSMLMMLGLRQLELRG